ncbi:hypothetical protein AVEN_147952-1 [Araneus ventricosus]|uniref:Uncharacterized protein n=1 Tax=Araneus ventricosus TaxID=182803 RepID=A0A4Y2WDT8_ARAVE|nr:hypothetical protein AVEN_147952-1 [Araneus ventricosus]
MPEIFSLPSDSIPRWPGKVSTSEPEGFQDQNPIPLKIRRLLGLFHVRSYVDGQTFSRCCGAEVWRGGCQLWCRSRYLNVVQNYEDRDTICIPRVASKRDDNITKLT